MYTETLRLVYIEVWSADRKSTEQDLFSHLCDHSTWEQLLERKIRSGSQLGLSPS